VVRGTFLGWASFVINEEPFQVWDIRRSEQIGQTDITRIHEGLITIPPDGKHVAASDYSDPSTIVDVNTGISHVLKHPTHGC
jgi:hypothetical protein